ncbi:ChrR family anti-sigma-E factor [Shewanella fidelis]|uniref:ChrR family anti-sigma-E factor n=1 Tax=Shewanella fidelis TaxID=173509 RepID=A0AAW8NK40_9GAMM|nr:ChrR family anti-sigma-E factor [Shewanella fidelis]MDR8523634.1 ChrR family anti-sigma-E factor [Shewanella fidelis]MDW4810181.1 ChrR family anti-sigma-E factor [Shewanella fidelis]MDW4814326.1 ChrR family anti-sigma-E factor [Shewanella fidelis]MDW4818417.1 ChrR family anti-sigma-E factor [Shewanella fidelis]MDW4823931.1 ChrR family anti-sigma-E factor [Shewanella fidelis]
MIKFHPKDEMLKQHANGQLHLGLATAVSAHCELCSVCRDKLKQYTAAQAEQHLGEQSNDDIQTENVATLDNLSIANIDFSDMLKQITQLAPVEPTESQPTIVEVKNTHYALPRALTNQVDHNWSGFGKISRMRLNTDENNSRASLLHIDAGGEIPEHSHTGREITLLLEGNFEDEFSQYVPGDFIELDANHQHSPKTINGCLCYTVVDAPLHFTKGISKILNPIGELIY